MGGAAAIDSEAEAGTLMKNVAPEVYFSGCWNCIGHFVYMPSGKRLNEDGVGPWVFLDSKRLHPPEHGSAWLTHEAGWTALGIGDLSVDNRVGANSTFAIRGIYNFTEALDIAYLAFPHIVDRIGNISLKSEVKE